MKHTPYPTNDFLDIVCQNSNLMVLITDEKGEMVFVNKKFTETTGYTLNEVIGKNPSILSAGVLPKEFYKDLWDKINSGENWEGVFINKKKDGSIYYESSTISPIKNEKGKTEYFIAIKHEVTDKEKLIDAATKHMAHYIPPGILVTDSCGKSVFATRGMEKILKTDIRHILDKKITKTFKIFKNETELDLEEILARQHNVSISESIIFYKDITVFANLTAIKITQASKHIGNIIVIEDITEKKEIIKKQKKLAEIEKLSVFLMGFGHDFNNLLAITQIQLQSAELYVDKDKDKAKEKLKKVSQKLNEISKLISSFFETTTAKPIFSKSNINLLIKNIINEYKNQYKNTEFRFTEKGEYIILIDKEKIKYTVKKILENAIEAQDYKGKVDITVGEASLPETLSLQLPKKRYVKISIKDYGKGIKKEYLPLLFTPYFTTKERTSEKQTGLSLAVCNFNVHKHGGYINVITEEGKGCEFIIYLPFPDLKTR